MLKSLCRNPRRGDFCLFAVYGEDILMEICYDVAKEIGRKFYEYSKNRRVPCILA